VGSAGLAPLPSQLGDFAANNNEFIIWKFEGNAVIPPPMIWEGDYLKKGNILLLPIASLPFVSRARGAGMYLKPGFEANFPLILEPIGSVTNGFGNFKMGWEMFEIKQVSKDN